MPLDASPPPGRYVGRFAPSPSGPLHAGSLVAALASFLDARARHGEWLLRIEDIDTPRTVAGADGVIMGQLDTLGMRWDRSPVRQSERHSLYAQAFARLQADGRTYDCTCSRRDRASGPYPGTCRPGAATRHAIHRHHATARPSWRFLVEPGREVFQDRWLGPQSQNVASEVGDFIIRRADGLWAYQLVVVVDDAAQGVTDVVRGADLLDSTARQRQLARALGLPAPRMMHVPLVLDADGRKLSKQNHAPALELADPLQTLQRAWQDLGFVPFSARSRDVFLSEAAARWARRFP